MIDISRGSFQEEISTVNRACSCGCGEQIHIGDLIYVRPYTVKRKQTGVTHLIDLEDHYQAWVSNVARGYAAVRAKRDPEFKKYLNGI